MSKAVLVMDMPQTCYECDMCNNEYCAIKRQFCYNSEEKRAEWCPLASLPEERYFCTGEVSEYDNGWNDCLLELAKMGGKHENTD